MQKNIAQIVVGLPVEGPFDYLVKEEHKDNIQVGQRVSVFFNHRKRVGVVVGFVEKSELKRLHTIINVLDNYPSLDESAVALTKKMSSYYGCSWGEAMETYLPPPLRRLSTVAIKHHEKANELTKKESDHPISYHCTTDFKYPTNHQLQKIQAVVAQGGGVIVLAPESQMMRHLAKTISLFLKKTVAVFDKALTPSQELLQWVKVRNGDIKVVVGARSAVFAPVMNVGLIVVYDDDHASYKQEQSPYYHAVDVVLMRQKLTSCDVLFVNAAPSAELWYRAKREQWGVHLGNDQVDNTIQMVDMTNYNPRKTSIISFPLQNAIGDVLGRNGKVLLYINRRGVGSITHCDKCGYVVKCPRCDVSMTHLSSQKVLVCRYCEKKIEATKTCPSCQNGYLRSMIKGIEKLEDELKAIYPQKRIFIFDKDSRNDPGSGDVVIATQAVLNHVYKLNPHLIGVLNADAELSRMDFRAAQRTFSLLVRLRSLAKEKFVVQSYMIDNYCLQAVKSLDFELFYKEELQLRKDIGLPPYQHLAALGVRGPDLEDVVAQADEFFLAMQKELPSSMILSDPHPDTRPKLRDQYRYVVVLKGPVAEELVAFAKSVLPRVKRKKKIIVTLQVQS